MFGSTAPRARSEGRSRARSRQCSCSTNEVVPTDQLIAELEALVTEHPFP
jgi:hypothetical protein